MNMLSNPTTNAKFYQKRKPGEDVPQQPSQPYESNAPASADPRMRGISASVGRPVSPALPSPNGGAQPAGTPMNYTDPITGQTVIGSTPRGRKAIGGATHFPNMAAGYGGHGGGMTEKPVIDATTTPGGVVPESGPLTPEYGIKKKPRFYDSMAEA